MADAPPITLYDFPGSPCARRVRITLIEKGYPYRTVLVDLSRLEQKDPAYLRLNPNGVVPTLTHGERVLYESNVITEYLDDVLPDVRLYPDDAWARAQVKSWQAFELSLAKDYRPLMYQRLLGPIVRLTRTLDEALDIARRSTTNPFDLEWERKVWSLAVLAPDEEAACAERLYERVAVLERALAGKQFLVGDRFTQAEISLFPRLRMYPYVQLPIAADRFPNLAAWMARLEWRPSFAQSLFSSDRGMQSLSRTGVLPWIAARLKRPPESWSLSERLRVRAAGWFFTRMTARGDDVAQAKKKVARGAEPPAYRGTYVAAGRARPAAAPHTEPLTLYDSPWSPSCRRVRILLREMGLSWTARPVDLTRLEHQRPPFTSLNPNGEVPVLVHGARVLCDSALIGEYLDDVFASDGWPSLFPRGAYARAQAKMWVAWDQALHKEWRPLWFHAVVGPLLRAGGQGAAALPEADEKSLRQELLRKLARLEQALADRAVLIGDAVSVADIACFSRLEMFPALGIPIEADQLPNICRWMAALARRPAFGPEPTGRDAAA